ncbi:bidirectional sugar transporter SWEET14-like [Cornus florida]|uniref:bidirectional sugar transporter SWEET14-like n=1 Tax=Cornus florida TaxID=4283 RepID=UPI00289EAA2D|nr:bidirectional sugar transporter SWEET14-like [Cornus florida]
MAIITTSHMAFAFGILGNIVSFLVYLAPLPTFYRIYKKKSTEGFQSIPYAVALFSAMLLLYYGSLKTNGIMIITINCIGCVIEATYLIIFMIYATKEAKIYTTKVLILFNVGTYGLILLFTSLFSHGKGRVTIVGWICAVFSVSVFAAPLSIMRLVIKTKSVEFMPFSLSFFLTLCAIMWFFYGLLIKDFFVATPNILGFIFGIAQMILYIVYKDRKKQVLPVVKLHEITTFDTDDLSLSAMAVQENSKADVEADRSEDITVSEDTGIVQGESNV